MLKLNAEFDPLLKPSDEVEEEAFGYVREGLADGRGVVLVAEFDGNVAGIPHARIVYSRSYAPRLLGHVDKFYVVPGFRRKEVGSVLLSRVEEELRRKALR